MSPRICLAILHKGFHFLSRRRQPREVISHSADQRAWICWRTEIKAFFFELSSNEVVDTASSIEVSFVGL